MQENVARDIYNLLKQSYFAIKQKQIYELRELSDHTIHDASIFQDEDSISIAIVVYSLSKIFEKHQFQEYPDWNFFYKNVMFNLKNAIKELKKRNVLSYRKSIENIMIQIKKIDKKVSLYIEEVLSQAKIRKGSRLYEHGISLGRASELLGVSKWELMSYVGNQKISEYEFSPRTIIEKIEFSKRIFNLK